MNLRQFKYGNQSIQINIVEYEFSVLLRLTNMCKSATGIRGIEEANVVPDPGNLCQDCPVYSSRLYS